MSAIHADRSAQRSAGWDFAKHAESFAGGTWDQAVQWAETGHPAAAAAAQAFIDKLEAKLPADVVRPRIGWDVAPGQYFDIGRIMEGEPEHWASPVPRRGLPIRILINQVASAAVDARELATRSAACAALAHCLQAAGESVEIHAGIGIKTSPTDKTAHCITWCVSEAGAQLSLDSAAFWLGYPAAFRQLGFALMEKHMPELTRAWGHDGSEAYGYPAPFPATVAAQYDRVIDFRGMADNNAWGTEAETIDWVLTQLATFINPTPATEAA
jgi:hypothetical protein